MLYNVQSESAEIFVAYFVRGGKRSQRASVVGRQSPLVGQEYGKQLTFYGADGWLTIIGRTYFVYESDR